MLLGLHPVPTYANPYLNMWQIISLQQGILLLVWVGLTDYNIRFANQPNGSTGNGHFEIVSLTGVLSTHGSHIHISISDSTGKTIGGHLMDGCKVYTTAELIIGQDYTKIFTRGGG